MRAAKYLRFQQSLQSLMLWILLSMCAHAFAANQDKLLDAKAAYDKKEIQTLANLADDLSKDQYLLAPYAEYWLMLSVIDQLTADEVQSFLTRYADYPFANNFRAAWLKQLGKHQNWKAFLAMYPAYQGQNRSLECLDALAQADAQGSRALIAYKSLWLQGKSQPGACDALYDKMQATGVLKDSDVRARFRLALKHNRRSLAKSIATRSNYASAKIIKQVDLAYKRTEKVLSKRLINIRTSYGKELYLYALDRIARKDSSKALKAFGKIKKNFNAEARSYFYGRLALHAAKRHESQAYTWFKLAVKHSALDKEQFEWYARSALRQQNWKGLLHVISLMPVSDANHATWRYWRGRAYKAINQPQKAAEFFIPLSAERHYYGWLAKDELGDRLNTQARHFAPNQQAVITFGDKPAVKRALALKKLGFDYESKMEWRNALKGLDDRELIAAAEFAQRKEWYIDGIYTADKTQQVHNYDLRYPRPYRHLIKPAARERDIDEAWVYGIMRQESRFEYDAKSRTGAIGLMQVMPATAKWMAKKIGYKSYKRSKLGDVKVNIKLGTHYMQTVLAQFNGQETMTTAAYNAGPSRAKRWQANTPLDGTIYAETIPFNETRNYVKRVMANAHVYAQRLNLEQTSLKARVGTIPARQ